MVWSSERSPGLLQQLQAGLHRCNAVGASVLVAVSGGADSVALLRGLLQLREPLKLTLRVAHLNHQLRGAESDADADWVMALCLRNDVACDIESFPILTIAEHNRRGIEETARDTRYEFLQNVAVRHQCDVVSVAHTADDQAETVLHHILRGTGLTGLRGMEWSRSLGDSTRLVRPMLEIWRTEVERFLEELGQEFRQDASNQDVSLTRNRLRHELLPRLEQDFNPRVREHLCQLAEQAVDIEEALQVASETLLDAALLDHSRHVVRLRRDTFSKTSRQLVREVFVRLWQRQNWPRQLMTFSHWNRLVDLIQRDHATAIDLPGSISVRRRANLLVLECGESTQPCV